MQQHSKEAGHSPGPQDRDIARQDDKWGYWKSRAERSSSLTSLFDYLEKKDLLDYSAFRSSPTIELQAGDAPVASLLLEKCRPLGFTPEIFAVDSDPDACASMRSHQDLPDNHIIQSDLVEGMIDLIEHGVEPGLVTITNFLPFQNYSLPDIIAKLTTYLPAHSRLLITCADDILEGYQRALSFFQNRHPPFSHLKLLLGERYEFVTYIVFLCHYMLFVKH